MAFDRTAAADRINMQSKSSEAPRFIQLKQLRHPPRRLTCPNRWWWRIFWMSLTYMANNWICAHWITIIVQTCQYGFFTFFFLVASLPCSSSKLVQKTPWKVKWGDAEQNHSRVTTSINYCVLRRRLCLKFQDKNYDFKYIHSGG